MHMTFVTRSDLDGFDADSSLSQAQRTSLHPPAEATAAMVQVLQTVSIPNSQTYGSSTQRPTL